MSLHLWSTRWLKTSLLLLLLILLCSLGLFLSLLVSRSSSESIPTMNQVRLKVNPLLLKLEQNSSKLRDPVVQEQVRARSQQREHPFYLCGAGWPYHTIFHRFDRRSIC
ncbi:hypothetical protein [Paenibacillus sp. AN1007]|uniref:Uncharacterized protein n=1 Tax=Paenibacillus sp. AN1007 TaxID=3151385 RepID=A0AAU8NE97_9BACL